MNNNQIIEQAKRIEVITRNIYHVWTNDKDWYEARRGEYLFDWFEPTVLHRQKFIDLSQD